MDSMEFHGIHGIPWIPWNSMDSMEFHGIHGIPWIPWNTVDCTVRSGPVPVRFRFRSGSGSGSGPGPVPVPVSNPVQFRSGPVRSGPSAPVSGTVAQATQLSRWVWVGRAGSGWVGRCGSPQVGRDLPAATHPTERNATRTRTQRNENENSRTPAGPQTNAPRDKLTPCGSPTPHSNHYLCDQ